MNDNHIILIFGDKWHLMSLQNKGFKVTNILLKETYAFKDPSSDTFMLSESTIVLENIKHLEAYVSLLCKIHNIKAIISLTDTNDGVYHAHYLSQKFNIGNPTQINPLKSVEILKNKGLTRKHLEDHGINSIPYKIVSSSEEAIAFFKEHNSSFILKPLDSQGSQYVNKVGSIDEIERYFKRIELSNILMEAYIEGQEFSVEAVSFKGKHHILGITEKQILGHNDFGHNTYVEKGHTFPAPILEKDKQSIENYVKTLLGSLEIKSGPSHTEIKLTTQGPILIESHLRPGGDLIPRLIKISTNLDIFSLAVESYCKETLSLDTIEKKLEASICFLTPKPGKINDIIIPESLKNNPEIYKLNLKKKIGDTISIITETKTRNVGYIVVKGDQNTYEKANDYINTVKIKTSNIK
ncbi:ATP-grasp domain-containing protein [Bacillus thuringiensis]|uniref:ATP-grasp domain-containing protein n=1 Tax=Bacillus thuringiensis TaxID=1428 RepID=UPI000BF759E9|nr:ATP-grasp domain-containing protein [Bacillus thuringiensis]PFU70323.1 hypothetical protein COK95_09445 [Bacillus thuringiensis]